MTGRWKGVIGFILCAVWLAVTVAFFAMITSGGEASSDLEIGPYLKLHDTPTVVFSRVVIGFGLLMLVLFLWKKRTGYLLALVWSAWWAVMLSTALLSPSFSSERISLLVGISLFIASGWFSLARMRKKFPRPADQT